MLDTDFHEHIPIVEETPRFFGANMSPVNIDGPNFGAYSKKIFSFPNLESSSSEELEPVQPKPRALNRSFLRAKTNKSTHSDISGIYDEQYWQKQTESLINEKKTHLQENYSLHC